MSVFKQLYIKVGSLYRPATREDFAVDPSVLVAQEAQSVVSTDLHVQPTNAALKEIVLPNVYPQKAAAVVHPSLLRLRERWNGYRYWMAWTPYPGYDSQYENPCVAASNDLETWVEPARNPLVEKPAGGYNADTHLFMSPDGARMYLAFRERIIGGNNSVKVMHTDDGGLSWSAPVAILSGAQGSIDFASPSIWWNGSTWTMISHQLDAAAPWPVRRNVSATSDIYGSWGAATTVTLAPPTGRAWWHSHHVRMPSGQVVALFQDNNQTAGSSGTLYLAESADDGATYASTGRVWTAGGKYRSTFAVRSDGALDIVASEFATIKLFYINATTGAKARVAAALARHTAALTLPANLPPGSLWADTCTRADSTTSPGTADSGGIYTVSSGTWGINGNRLYPVASGRLLAESSTTEHVAQVKFVDITTSIQQWLIGRAVDGSNYWRVGVTAPTASGLQTLALQNVVAGAIGAINKAVGQFQRGDSIAIEGTGALIRIYVNGLVIWEEPCITSAAGTKCGLQANAGANTYFKNFTILTAA